MSNISATIAGIAFVALASANVMLMLEASQTSRSAATRTRLIALHRAGGYFFVILFCLMAYSMSQRLAGSGITGHLPVHLVLHIVLVLALIPLFLLKILFVRRYKQSHSSPKVLGTAIFIISFLLVSIPVFSELIRSSKPGSLGLKVATGVVVGVCLVQGSLVFRKRQRPDGFEKATRAPQTPTQATPLTERPNANSPMNLLLAQTEQQTHDTKTLRFQVPKERRISAKPGQFLAFQWIIDGQKVTRSYTISSSPTRENYLEITPKRMENGCVSVFLNDRAKPGLRVEASGPYGQFYFDETLHKNIVLIAAGSGITPMISILRYVDDLKLPTPVTLLYCVRTAADIIFQKEFARLRTSLPNFKYEVCLSRPDPAWNGHSGRLSGEFVSQHIINLELPTYFLCGPAAFMENARQILSSLGVNHKRILQESFGESKRRTEPGPLESHSAETVVFIRSEKVCQISAGGTLLDLAEQNKVHIPYGCRQGLCGTCATRVLSGWHEGRESRIWVSIVHGSRRTIGKNG